MVADLATTTAMGSLSDTESLPSYSTAPQTLDAITNALIVDTDECVSDSSSKNANAQTSDSLAHKENIFSPANSVKVSSDVDNDIKTTSDAKVTNEVNGTTNTTNEAAGHDTGNVPVADTVSVTTTNNIYEEGIMVPDNYNVTNDLLDLSASLRSDLGKMPKTQHLLYVFLFSEAKLFKDHNCLVIDITLALFLFVILSIVFKFLDKAFILLVLAI